MVFFINSCTGNILLFHWEAIAEEIYNYQQSNVDALANGQLFKYLNIILLPSIFPSIRVSVLHIRWPKNWSFSFSISPSNEYSL